MKHTKTVEVPAHTKLVVEKVTCDVCGAEMFDRGAAVSEVTVSCRTGVAYPEGGNGEKVSFDVCAACFKTKLRPFLEGLGAVATETEWDF